jgi:uncharacterized membrane protein HdeD (DUF308 family)
MLAIRGGLGIVFGLVVLLGPQVRLGEVVTLFGTYAILDGLCAVAWAVRASRRARQGWSVVAEGVASVALGALALWFPFTSGRTIHVIAVWGLVTGILEILAAVRPPYGVTGHRFLAASGVWSVFLAVFILRLPYALTDALVDVIGVYALVFGVLVLVASFLLRSVIPPPLLRGVGHTWPTR